MRVLVLGGDGMLGHRLLLDLSANHEVKATLRRDRQYYASLGIYTPDNSITGIDARDAAALETTFAAFKPDVVMNAVGIVKQRRESDDAVQSIEVNALLPHRLAALCRVYGSRLIHVSTDCVFAGDQGNYSEEDPADATDLYGRSKLLGEVNGPGCLTLRTSMIGLELGRKGSLVEWYLAQRGKIKGFTGAIYSGLTTMEFSRVVQMLLDSFPALEGVYHVVSQPISKYDLLIGLNTRLGRTDLEIEADSDFRCDRSMRGDAFLAATNYCAPNWDEMLDELAQAIRARGAKHAAGAERRGEAREQ